MALLDPIEPGLDKETFMLRLERAIETRSIELLGDEADHGFRLVEFQDLTVSQDPVVVILARRRLDDHGRLALRGHRRVPG